MSTKYTAKKIVKGAQISSKTQYNYSNYVYTREDSKGHRFESCCEICACQKKMFELISHSDYRKLNKHGHYSWFRLAPN